VPDAKREERDRLGRLVGAALITEGVLVAILRFLTLVYVFASEAYSADRFHEPLPSFIPWVASTAIVSFVLVWAGSFLRREPAGAWAGVGVYARIALVAACLLNVAALAMAVTGLARLPSGVEATVAWIALGIVSLVSIIGLVRDARRPATD
jgi:hypothetical protein